MSWLQEHFEFIVKKCEIMVMVTSSNRLFCNRLLVGTNQNACVTQFIMLSTNKFHVHVRLFRDRLNMTSKWGINKKNGTRGTVGCGTDVFIAINVWLILWCVNKYLRAAIRPLLVLKIEQAKTVSYDVIYASVLQ